MRTVVWQRLDIVARGLVPAVITLVLLIVTLIPTHLPGFGSVMPALMLMSVYYWAVHRPDLLPLWAVFAFGLLQDLLTGAPPGIHTVVLLLAYAAVLSQRKFFHGKSFAVVWWGFMVIAAGAGFLHWFMLSAMAGRLIDPWQTAFAYFMSVAVYPLLAWCFTRVHRTLPTGQAA